jgi:hypothetical protein
MHDTLNFFDPNTDIPSYHENQLTRAFLVVLRLSPAAHQVWLSLAAPDRKLYELQRPWSFDTQRSQMFSSVPEVGEPIEGISVLQAADEQVIDGQVQITDRRQVLDGIVRYGDELLIVVETKLDGPVAARQAQDLNVHGAHVRFADDVHTVSWRDLLAGWYDLVESEVVTGSERALIVDFLDFFERRFARLGSFTTLGRCKDQKFRVSRRLNAVLDEIAGGLTRDWLELPDRSTVDRAFLAFDELSKQISLVVYPADTLTQAKAFYTRPEAVSSVLSLREVGWEVMPNFHFGHMAPGFVWTTTDAPLEEYVAYWCEQIGRVTLIHREKWEEFWRGLVQRRVARNEEKKQFDQYFTNTLRKSATPRPGLACSYSWKLPEAKLLDDEDRLVLTVAEQLNIVLGALGEKLYESRVSSRIPSGTRRISGRISNDAAADNHSESKAALNCGRANDGRAD